MKEKEKGQRYRKVYRNLRWINFVALTFNLTMFAWYLYRTDNKLIGLSMCLHAILTAFTLRDRIQLQSDHKHIVSMELTNAELQKELEKVIAMIKKQKGDKDENNL